MAGAKSVSIAPMESAAAKKQAPMHRFSVRSRFNLVLAVAYHMDEADFKRLLRGVEPPEEFKLSRVQGDDQTKQATISRAVDFIYNDSELMKALGVPMCLTPDQQKQCIENGCRSWVKAWGNRNRTSLADLPRTAKGGLQVSADDLYWLGDLLVNVTYVDDEGNKRRFGSLDQILQHCEHVDLTRTFAERQEAAERAQRLISIRLRTKGNILDALISRAADARG